VRMSRRLKDKREGLVGQGVTGSEIRQTIITFADKSSD